MAERRAHTRDGEHASPSIDTGVIVKAGLVLLAVVAATIAAAFALHATGVGRHGSVFGPGVSGEAVQDFPQPRLQTQSDRERVRYFAEQRRRAAEYGWVDREHGVVRIPVERAMALLAAENGQEGGEGRR